MLNFNISKVAYLTINYTFNPWGRDVAGSRNLRHINYITLHTLMKLTLLLYSMGNFAFYHIPEFIKVELVKTQNRIEMWVLRKLLSDQEIISVTKTFLCVLLIRS